MTMISDAAIAIAATLAKRFEGCKLAAYQNAHDVPTIGYGHTAGVQLGDTCSGSQADAWLAEDLQNAANGVRDAVTKALGDNQAAALVDWVYNLGQGRLTISTLLAELNDGNYADVPRQMMRWVHDAGGTVLGGLVARRQAEADLWNAPDA